MTDPISLTVNGTQYQVTPASGQSLLELLRDGLGITGPKLGCGEGACGACTVLIGSRPVQACQLEAAGAAGQRITTVEGLAEDGILHPVQQAFLETGAMQCGYCTPGWLTAAAALLTRVTQPSDARIDAEFAGHVCRCCTYVRIRQAVHRAAELMERPDLLEPLPPQEPGRGYGAAGQPEPGQVAPGRAEAGQAGPGQVGPAQPRPLQPESGPLKPASPWDLNRTQPGSFADAMPDGLMTVVAEAGEPGFGGPDDAWVHVGADGRITAYTGKVEAGQGTRTALSLLVGEELAVPPSSVALSMADTDTSPFDLGTFGSRSMPHAAPPLRAAAAAARRILTEAAAERFGLPAEALTAADGMIAGPDGAPSASYGELVAGQRRVERVPADAPVTPASRWRSAGHAARAAGGTHVVTGAKRFPSDLRVDGMLHGCVLRPPSHGATLRHADTSAAAALPDVTVVTEDSFVAVTAPDQHAARAALAAITAEWDELPGPATADLEDYLRAHPVEGEGFAGSFRHDSGDADTALATGPVRRTGRYLAAYVAHAPMEPRAALAQWEDGQLTVWTGTSTPFRARRELAAELSVAEDQVHVIVPDFGGGFGGKHGSAVAAEAARLARATGRPVRVQWTRAEEFSAAYLRPAAFIDAAASADAAGELTGWSFENLNSGAVGIMTPYRVPSQRIRFQPAAAPLPQGSYRALAATANNFARESLMDEMAAATGTDPVEFRLRHLDDERLAAVLRAAAADIRTDAPRAGDEQPAGERTGTGIALGFEKGGRVATAARVAVAADGTLRLLRLVTAVDCGAVVHPDGLVNQVEGAVVMGLGPALFEQIEFDGRRISNGSMTEYRVPRLGDVPVRCKVILLDQPGEPSAGGGEAPIIAVAPAIANAIYWACGMRLRTMPLVPDGRVPGVPARAQQLSS